MYMEVKEGQWCISYTYGWTLIEVRRVTEHRVYPCNNHSWYPRKGIKAVGSMDEMAARIKLVRELEADWRKREYRVADRRKAAIAAALAGQPIPPDRVATLVSRVASLNAAAGEIGPGMLAQLVTEAQAILEGDLV